MTALPESEDTPRSTDAATPATDETEARPPLYAVPDESAAETTGEIPAVVNVPPSTGAVEQEGGEQEPGKNRERIHKVVAFLKAAFTPQSGLYADRHPSIAETVRRAKQGGHLADAGPLRKAAIVYGYLAAALKAVAYTVVWIVDHPARLVAALTVVALALGLLLAL